MTAFVEHVRDAVVTDLVYRHLPSWHAVGCYFDWRAHYAAEQRKREGVGRRRRDGAVLTEEGWLLPRGEMNPRVLVIDEPRSLTALAAVLEQQRTDAEVNRAREEHEAALLAEDLWLFERQWSAAVVGRASAWLDVLRAAGRSEEREAFMVRWHAQARTG